MNKLRSSKLEPVLRNNGNEEMGRGKCGFLYALLKGKGKKIARQTAAAADRYMANNGECLNDGFSMLLQKKHLSSPSVLPVERRDIC